MEVKQEAEKEDRKYADRTRYRWWIISCQSGRFGKYDPDDPVKRTDYLIRWQLFVMVLAIYNSFITPFQFSFEYVQQLLEHQPLSTIESVIDVIYMIDIVVGFQTSYIDYFTGDEITKPSMIAKRYLTADFTIDILSTVPFKLICIHVLGMTDIHHMYLVLFKVCKLLKVFRLRKVGKMIRDFNTTKEMKAGLQILFMTFLLVIYSHVIACIMWYMMKTDKLWVPAVDFGAV